MIITERTSGVVTILDLEGKWLQGEGDMLLKLKIYELLESGENKIVINLAQVPYMDGGGLRDLVKCYTAVHDRNSIGLKLLNPNKRIMDLLTITKLITVFEVFQDEAVAVASYS